MNKNLKGKISYIMALALAIEFLSNANAVKANDEFQVDIIQDGKEITKEIIVGKPSNFKGEVKGLDVMLTWDAPESKEGLVGYTLYMNGKVIAELNETAISHKVEGLKENTPYGFKIVSNYSNGQSSKAVSINIRTEIIKAKVRDFVATDITSNSLTLKWNKPEYPGGLTGYSIYENGELIAELDASNNKYSVSELKENTIYSYKIIANYTNGHSKPVSLNVRTAK